MSVVDREALQEALATLDAHGVYTGVKDSLALVFAAARSVLEGEATGWCEEHRLPPCDQSYARGHCEAQHPLDGPVVGPCSMVRVVVVPIEDGVSS